MPKNRIREAFQENSNVIGLATAFGASLVLLNPLPLLAGVVAEAVYLLFVPDSKWYERRLSKRHDAEIEKRRQDIKARILPTLRPEVQERFRRLEETRYQIGVGAADEERWFREVLRKLDYLLEKFLLFASKERQFRSYLTANQEQTGVPQRELRDGRRGEDIFWDGKFQASDKERSSTNKRSSHGSSSSSRRGSDAPPPVPASGNSDAKWVQMRVEQIQEGFTQDLEDLKVAMEQEEDNDTRAIMAKRADVLQRRLEEAGKIGKILVNLNHQLQLLEDTFGLINDEIRARSPEQVLTDIDEVVLQTDSMTQALDEVASLEQLTSRL